MWQYSLITEDIGNQQKHFLIVQIFTFWFLNLYSLLCIFMILNPPALVDNINFEKSQKVEKYLIDGV